MAEQQQNYQQDRLDEELVFEVNADLLYDALQITPKDPDHPFVTPPPHDDILSFIKKLGYPEDPEQVSKMINVVLGNLKFTNKGEKDPIYGMAIPMKMMRDEIKASTDYSNYLAKSKGYNVSFKELLIR
ncbi:hypothetical protein Tco_0837628 [Tanacetum coccineum]